MTRQEMEALANEILMIDPEQALLEMQQEAKEAARKCDLCGRGEGETVHVCTESDPGDPFAQPITEDEQAWLDFLSAE